MLPRNYKIQSWSPLRAASVLLQQNKLSQLKSPVPRHNRISPLRRMKRQGMLSAVQLSHRNIQGPWRVFARSVATLSSGIRWVSRWTRSGCSSHRPVTTAICKTQPREDGARFAYGQRFFSLVVYSIEPEHEDARSRVEGRRERGRRGGWSARGRERAWRKRGRIVGKRKRRVFERRHAPVNVDVETRRGRADVDMVARDPGRTDEGTNEVGRLGERDRAEEHRRRGRKE